MIRVTHKYYPYANLKAFMTQKSLQKHKHHSSCSSDPYIHGIQFATCLSTNSVKWIILLLSMWKVLGSNLGLKTGYHIGGISQSSSVLPGKSQDCTTNQITTTCFHSPFNSLPFRHSTIQHYLMWATNSHS